MLKRSATSRTNEPWQHKANLHWIVNGKVHETIKSDVPYAVAKAEKNKCLCTNHYKLGKLVVVSVNASDQTIEDKRKK